MHSLRRVTRRQFVAGAGAATGALFLRTPPAAAGQDPVVDAVAVKGKTENQEQVPWRVEPFALKQVRLLDGPFKDAMEINHKWLVSLPSDRLLHSFRITAGISSSAEPLGGWEKPDCELRGHFAGGHYLSGCALAYAATGDDEIKSKANNMVAELAQCQENLKSGYLSAFPEEEFDRLREERRVWAPFYTYHKIMAGLLDMYLYCGNPQALDTAEKMAGWVGHWGESISDEHLQRILQTEYGGMMEVLGNLYAVTGKRQYLYLAHRFEKKMFFDPLAAHRDELKGLHANTHIPQVIGAARLYELTGNPRFRAIADYFWSEVTSERAYCTGGTSNGEHWRTDPGKLAAELGKYTEECCCAYNMLKLTRHVFGWSADARAMDYYERTLYNHRLGTQDAQGMKSYFLPLGSGYWKYYNSPLDSFWCCTGTGAEEFAKFADSIYFHDARGVFVNLFIPSEVNWTEKGVRVRQETKFPEEGATTLTLRTHQPVEMTLNIRVPYWATRGGAVKLNGAAQPVFSSPSSYLSIHRTWKDGDKVEVSLPMSLHIHPMPDDPTLQAMMYGPLVLAGRLGQRGLTPALTYPGYDTAPGGDPIPVPAIANPSHDRAGWVEPDSGQALTFRTAGREENIEFIPLHKVSGERYAVYWKVNTQAV
ncbi:MAG TPA: beta-L-arabinofuranosidase domain-containing protein [Terriglobia bacterium]|nr:beta-L-arabinofuranosidase domain-containing protein [Terriglobia bacterium]